MNHGQMRNLPYNVLAVHSICIFLIWRVLALASAIACLSHPGVAQVLIAKILLMGIY